MSSAQNSVRGTEISWGPDTVLVVYQLECRKISRHTTQLVEFLSYEQKGTGSSPLEEFGDSEVVKSSFSANAAKFYSNPEPKVDALLL
jgi:hypothetical protein